MTSVAARQKYCPACQARYPIDGLFCPADGSPLVDDGEEPARRSDPYLRREILDHIEIRELAGIGAMGRVYRAFQKGIDRDVAVKVLHRELSANAQLVNRFLREAKVASRLQHPNVVHVLLSGQLPDGALYIVMEYLHGLSLQSAIAEADGAFDLARALHVSLQLCDAVGEAHVQGIVHRDLKPENVMLVRRGQDADFVKVLDFGIARLNWSEQSMATATGLIFGTARYISPEGAQGEKVGPEGDVYSIATLVYQMLAGRTPFEGDQAVGLLIQQIHEPPPPLRSHERAREVPPAIAEVVMRGLAKDPRARHENARAFGRALVEAARASGVAADDYYARSMYAQPASGAARVAKTPQSEPSVPAMPNAAPHAPSNSTRDVNDVPVAGPTAKWVPPPQVQAQLASVAADRKNARAPQPSTPQASVDPTLDDDDAQPAANGPAKTAYGPPTQVSAPLVVPARTPAGPTGTLPLNNDVEPVSDRVFTPAPRPIPQSYPSHPALARERQSSIPTVPPTRAEEEGPRRGRTIAIVVACFLLGVIGAVGLHKSGVLRTTSSPSPTVVALEAHLAKTRQAIDAGRWDAPPGDNVKALLAAGMVHYPNEPRLQALRIQASDTLIRRAVGLKAARDVKEAARLAQIASEIVPENDTTRALAAEYQHEVDSIVPPLPPVTSAQPNVAPPRPGGPAVQIGPVKVALDTTPSKPRIGQPVQLVAKVTGRANVSEAAFIVQAQGQPQATKLVPVSEGASHRAQFTFLEAGRYEVSFTGKSDGGAVRSSRVIVVEGNAPTPPSTPETPPPSGSVKWL